MKSKGLFFFVAVFFLTGCAVNKKPDFIKVDGIKIVDVTSGKITISAIAHFNNPNDIGGKLETKGVKVFVNDIEMAEVRSEQFKVPANKEFAVPMFVDIPTDKLKGKKGKDFLENLLETLLKQNIKVQFKGKLKYKVLGYSNYYDIDQTETLKIRL